MTIKIFLIIICSISLSAFAQIILKIGMSGSNIQSTLDVNASGWSTLSQAFVSPYVLAGLAMYGLGAILWLFVLARLDVSMAYPFVGLGFILTMLLGFLLLGEVLSILRIVGTLLVLIGVTLISVY